MRNKVLEMFREFQFCPGGIKMLKDDVLFVVVFCFLYKKSGFQNININCSNKIIYYSMIGGVMLQCNRAFRIVYQGGPWATRIFAKQKKKKKKKVWLPKPSVTMSAVAMSSLRI